MNDLTQQDPNLPEQPPVESAGEELLQKDVLASLFAESERNYWQRLRDMFKGLKMPKESIEYKAAMIEVQRLGAPLVAISLPILACLGLAMMKLDTKQQERKVEVELVDPTETQMLEEPPEPPDEKPPELDDPPVDIDTPVVDIDAPPTTSDVQSPQPREFDSVAQSPSVFQVKGIMGSRDPGSRGAAIGRYGGGNVEKYVVANLRYLKKVQTVEKVTINGEQVEVGYWGKAGGNNFSAPLARTSIVLLAYLAHGEIPGSPEFGDTVLRAIRFLTLDRHASKVGPKDALGGDNPIKGKFTFNGSHDPGNYTHPIMTYALSEAYAMTRNPDIKPILEKAVDTLVSGQTRDGGFGYNMNPNSNDRIDSSYMGWCVQALKAAKIAGVHNSKLVPALKKSIRGILVLQQKNGKFKYTNKEGHGGGLTAVGALALQLLGEADSPQVRKAQDYMKDWQPTFVNKKFATGSLGPATIYYSYYATQVKFFMGEKAPAWNAWNASMSRLYRASFTWVMKDKSGYEFEGVKYPIGYWGYRNRPEDLKALTSDRQTQAGKRMGFPVSQLIFGDGHRLSDDKADRALGNALVALQMMVYYRNSPTTKGALFKIDEVAEEAVTEGENEVQVEGLPDNF